MAQMIPFEGNGLSGDACTSLSETFATSSLECATLISEAPIEWEGNPRDISVGWSKTISDISPHIIESKSPLMHCVIALETAATILAYRGAGLPSQRNIEEERSCCEAGLRTLVGTIARQMHTAEQLISSLASLSPEDVLRHCERYSSIMTHKRSKTLHSFNSNELLDQLLNISAGLGRAYSGPYEPYCPINNVVLVYDADNLSKGIAVFAVTLLENDQLAIRRLFTKKHPFIKNDQTFSWAIEEYGGSESFCDSIEIAFTLLDDAPPMEKVAILFLQRCDSRVPNCLSPLSSVQRDLPEIYFERSSGLPYEAREGYRYSGRVPQGYIGDEGLPSVSDVTQLQDQQQMTPVVNETMTQRSDLHEDRGRKEMPSEEKTHKERTDKGYSTRSSTENSLSSDFARRRTSRDSKSGSPRNNVSIVDDRGTVIDTTEASIYPDDSQLQTLRSANDDLSQLATNDQSSPMVEPVHAVDISEAGRAAVQRQTVMEQQRHLQPSETLQSRTEAQLDAELPAAQNSEAIGPRTRNEQVVGTVTCINDALRVVGRIGSDETAVDRTITPVSETIDSGSIGSVGQLQRVTQHLMAFREVLQTTVQSNQELASRAETLINENRTLRTEVNELKVLVYRQGEHLEALGREVSLLRAVGSDRIGQSNTKNTLAKENDDTNQMTNREPHEDLWKTSLAESRTNGQRIGAVTATEENAAGRCERTGFNSTDHKGLVTAAGQLDPSVAEHSEIDTIADANQRAVAPPLFDKGKGYGGSAQSDVNKDEEYAKREQEKERQIALDRQFAEQLEEEERRSTSILNREKGRSRLSHTPAYDPIARAGRTREADSLLGSTMTSRGLLADDRYKDERERERIGGPAVSEDIALRNRMSSQREDAIRSYVTASDSRPSLSYYSHIGEGRSTGLQKERTESGYSSARALLSEHDKADAMVGAYRSMSVLDKGGEGLSTKRYEAANGFDGRLDLLSTEKKNGTSRSSSSPDEMPITSARSSFYSKPMTRAYSPESLKYSGTSHARNGSSDYGRTTSYGSTASRRSSTLTPTMRRKETSVTDLKGRWRP